MTIESFIILSLDHYCNTPANKVSFRSPAGEHKTPSLVIDLSLPVGPPFATIIFFLTKSKKNIQSEPIPQE
jgi:hypothetical protein